MPIYTRNEGCGGRLPVFMEFANENKPKIIICSQRKVLSRELKQILQNKYQILSIDRQNNLWEALKQTEECSIILVEGTTIASSANDWLDLLAKRYPNTVTIALSETSTLSVCQEARERGRIFDYIAVPCQKQVIVGVVEGGIRLNRFLQQRTQELRSIARREAMVNSITQAIRSTLEPQIIFTTITKQLGEALAVDGCALSLWTDRDEYVRCVGLYDRSETHNPKIPQSIVPISRNPVLQNLLQQQKPVIVNDLERRPELNLFDLPLRSPARALLIVPLIFEGEVIGSISLRQTGRSRLWQQAEIELVEAVASGAAIAVQQGKLYQQVQQLNTYLTESVLKRFLPPSMVRAAASGKLSLDLTPEPRSVTIVFSDIVGFTPLSSQLGAKRIAQLLDRYLEAMTKTVFNNGGTVDKFIGDAVMALFGTPEPLPPQEQIQKAIAASRGMFAALQQLNQQWRREGLFAGVGIEGLQMRCGIHHGSVVVGMFGGEERSDYTAIGPAVNMASRLQEVARPNTIFISEDVASYLPPESLSSCQFLRLKGIEAEVLTYSVSLV
jgi:adenylate cyclase